MAIKEEYDRAIGRVEAGHGSAQDYELANKIAGQAGGGQPSQARQALEKDARRNR